MKKLSVCYTNWNRYELIVDSFLAIIDHPLVEEIIISDDASDIAIYGKLKIMCNLFPKVKLHRNENNLNCYHNKYKAASLASNRFILMLDSDNTFSHKFLDVLAKEEWEFDTALMPSFSKPLFDYRQFEGQTITKENVAENMNYPLFRVMLNCCNYFVNKKFYMDCFDLKFNPFTADSIYINKKWLENGGKIKVVEGLEYFHLIHKESHYQTNQHLTGNILDEIENELRKMK